MTVALKVANINRSKICVSFFLGLNWYIFKSNKFRLFFMTLLKIKISNRDSKSENFSSPNTQTKK